MCFFTPHRWVLWALNHVSNPEPIGFLPFRLFFVLFFQLENVLSLAGRSESSSEHPLGRAIFKYCSEQGADLSKGCEDFLAKPGRGLSCLVDKDVVLLGNAAWMEDNGLQVTDDIHATMYTLQVEGKTAMLLSMGNIIVGVIAVADVIRTEVKQQQQQQQQHTHTHDTWQSVICVAGWLQLR